MTHYKSRSKSIENYRYYQPNSWLKTIVRRLKSSTRHRRNKSEKSVQSQTEVISVFNFNDSAIQCSEHMIKVDATRNSLLESYIFDISEKSLSKSDLYQIDKHRKNHYKPIKILNQIIHDVMTHFPEIDTSLTDLVENLINEFCIKFIKLQILNFKRSLNSEDNNKSKQESNKLSLKDRNKNESDCSPSAYTYKVKTENKILSDLYSNQPSRKYKSLNMKPEFLKTNEPIRHHFCKRYVVKKCRTTKENNNEIEVDNNINDKPKEKSPLDEYSIYQRLSTDKLHVSTSKEFENITNENPSSDIYKNQLCTVSISPMYFSPSNDKTSEIRISERYNTTSKIPSIESSNYLISKFKEKTNFDVNYSQIETANILSLNSMNPRKLSMAQGDGNDFYNQGFYCESSDKISKSHFEKRKMSSELENSSTLDLEIVFGSSDLQDDNQLKTDLSTNENLSINTDENSCQSRIKMYDTPVQVSILNSIETFPQCKIPYFPNNLENSNSTIQVKTLTKLNLFCESLCDKFSSKYNKNTYQCDTEMSFSTRQSKVPDQTILLSNAISNPSDTVCEVLSGKFTEDCNIPKPLKANKNSVKFLEVLSKDILNKTKFKSSSFLNHTIASKLKMKNSNQIS